MARRRHNFTSPTVEAIESFAAAHHTAPTGEYIVRQGSVWRTDHPVVKEHPHLFVDLGDGQTAERYLPQTA